METPASQSLFAYTYTPCPYAEKHLIISDCIGMCTSKDFYYSRETFDNNLILSVVRGTFYVEQYWERHLLTSGMSIFMKLTDSHTYYSDKVDVASIIWMHFRSDMLVPLLDTLYSHRLLPVITCSEEVKKTIYQGIQIASQKQDDFEYQISALIYPVILEVMGPHLLRIQNQTVWENSWFIKPVNQYIDNHIYEKITLDQLCSSVNMSKSYFCKVFKKYFSMSPMQYTMYRKINMSKYLLFNSDQSLEAIAHALGFSDQSHFSKTFKHYMGTTPLRYKNSKKEESPWESDLPTETTQTMNHKQQI